MAEIIRRDGDIHEEGQPFRDDVVIRLVKHKPMTAVVSEPKVLSSAVSGAFGSEIQTITETVTQRETVIGVERVRLRWWKPDASGKLVPR